MRLYYQLKNRKNNVKFHKWQLIYFQTYNQKLVKYYLLLIVLALAWNTK